MHNLEQERAKHALEKSKDLDRQAVNKLPALIMNNGLLATIAFATDGDSRGGMAKAMDAIADHLAKRQLIERQLIGEVTAKKMLEALAGKESVQLRLATEEALAYLVYLKRYAQKKTKENQKGGMR
ncbi:type III-B CRISPR module-associated protein Cmr5 [Methylacidimicrobium sp. B4]|uniref:type III-B CRISPR module-associated protein Cmr5 n=1 Tax=Methylacidimicrobium sp. B4 TaxID=2796139 RepID=UPI001A8FBEC3|nr:type III-B CRISPR module-associated protein Cmr5 [Methylacidimicrobium sp. B4]QSR84639.1 type III-B CRISPR module-associated protein Cmr5 [Methylacidimicrobium sp. B4]